MDIRILLPGRIVKHRGGIDGWLVIESDQTLHQKGALKMDLIQVKVDARGHEAVCAGLIRRLETRREIYQAVLEDVKRENSF